MPVVTSGEVVQTPLFLYPLFSSRYSDDLSIDAIGKGGRMLQRPERLFCRLFFKTPGEQQ